MKGFSLHEFLSSRNDVQMQAKLEERGRAGIDTALICGEPSTGKSSILFHYAFYLANQGKQVLFIGDKDKLEYLPPFLPEGVTKEDNAYNNVHMKYLKNSLQVRMFAACFHLLDQFPDAIVIDDIHSFVRNTVGNNIIRNKVEREQILTLGSLTQAVRHATKRKGSSCKLVLSCENFLEQGVQDLTIYQKWCQLILLTAGDVTSGYKLSVAPNPQTDSVTSKFYQTILKYDMLAGGLTLKEINT